MMESYGRMTADDVTQLASRLEKPTYPYAVSLPTSVVKNGGVVTYDSVDEAVLPQNGSGVSRFQSMICSWQGIHVNRGKGR